MCFQDDMMPKLPCQDSAQMAASKLADLTHRFLCLLLREFDGSCGLCPHSLQVQAAQTER